MREKLFKQSWTRTEKGDANDTRAIIAELASLRAEKAKLLGYPNYAAYVLYDQMAQTPEAVEKFITPVGAGRPAPRRREEAKLIQAAIDKDGTHFDLKPWDWQRYAEKVRKEHYDLDDAALKPYFELQQSAEERRLLCRQPALWPHLQGAQGHSGLSARCDGVSRCSTRTARRWA